MAHPVFWHYKRQKHGHSFFKQCSEQKKNWWQEVATFQWTAANVWQRRLWVLKISILLNFQHQIVYFKTRFFDKKFLTGRNFGNPTAMIQWCELQTSWRRSLVGQEQMIRSDFVQCSPWLLVHSPLPQLLHTIQLSFVGSNSLTADVW